jgi:cytochrome c oxidase cbb3-type subunit I/II
MRIIKHIAPGLALTGLLFILYSPQSAAKGSQGKPMPIKIGQYHERPPVNEASIADGRLIYERACIYCHGNEGTGKGPVAFFLSRDTGPRPRDFTLGPYKFRSTESGELPLDEDLFRTITRGIVGYMPGFVGLDAPDRWKLVYYIKSLAPEDFEDSQPEPIKVAGSPVPLTAMSVQRGYDLYQVAGCWECHGGSGKGDGEKAPELKDDSGMPLPPANLTMPNSFKAGSRPEDLYRTILTGLDGGAMPSHDRFKGHEEDVWDLVNYIRSLAGSK